MTAVSKNVYFDELDNIVNKYNNAVHRTIWNETDWCYIWFLCWIHENSNEKNPKFKIGDCVRISKYKNIFAKEYTQNLSEEVFVVSKIKNTVPWTYAISDLNGEEIVGTFYEKKFQKQIKKNSE